MLIAQVPAPIDARLDGADDLVELVDERGVERVGDERDEHLGSGERGEERLDARGGLAAIAAEEGGERGEEALFARGGGGGGVRRGGPRVLGVRRLLRGASHSRSQAHCRKQRECGEPDDERAFLGRNHESSGAPRSERPAGESHAPPRNAGTVPQAKSGCLVSAGSVT